MSLWACMTLSTPLLLAITLSALTIQFIWSLIIFGYILGLLIFFSILFYSRCLLYHVSCFHSFPSTFASAPCILKFKRRKENGKKLKILIMEATVWHYMSHSKLIVCVFLLSSVHCKESLLWIKDTGFYYTINAGPSLGLFLTILLLLFAVEILQLLVWVCRSGSIRCFSRS